MNSTNVTAEIIAIGDELVSGQRLDTNSQWISQRLGELGIEPIFHTCVGDDLQSGIELFDQAIRRSNIVITTGGIGPTKDDLTREVIAAVAGAQLEFHEAVETHIRSIFASHGREMPANNIVQAYFPEGAVVIDNAEGTAPGIDLTLDNSRIFALPGVPYEMKQMWEDHVASAIMEMTGGDRVIRNHAIHCFGAGESQVEEMLQGMTARDHKPRIGITASQATITLRVSAVGPTETDCLQQITTASEQINEKLGDLVFGCNGVTLEEVVYQQLLQSNQTIAIVDFGLNSIAGSQLLKTDETRKVVLTNQSRPQAEQQIGKDLAESATAVARDSNAKIGIAVSDLIHLENMSSYSVAIANGSQSHEHAFRYSGHSGLRESRTAKQILNFLRLNLYRFLD